MKDPSRSSYKEADSNYAIAAAAKIAGPPAAEMNLYTPGAEVNSFN